MTLCGSGSPLLDQICAERQLWLQSLQKKAQPKKLLPPKAYSPDPHSVPPLPVQRIKSVDERVAEAEIYRGKISKQHLDKIIYTIRRSALDCGEGAPPCEVKIVPPSVAKIQKVVAAHFNVNVHCILCHSRFPVAIRPRHIAIYLSNVLTSRSLSDIGRQFGRDHTSIMHAVRKMTQAIETDNVLADEIAAIKERLTV